MHRCGGGDGGFFFACEDLWRMFNNSFPTCTFFFFFKVEMRLCTLITLFWTGSVHSGSASWDDCGQVFPVELCVWAHFLIGSHTMPAQHHSRPTPTWYLVGSRVYACLNITCHLHFCIMTRVQNHNHIHWLSSWYNLCPVGSSVLYENCAQTSIAWGGGGQAGGWGVIYGSNSLRERCGAGSNDLPMKTDLNQSQNQIQCSIH